MQYHQEVRFVFDTDVMVALDALSSAAKQVRLSFRWRPILPDVNDDMVLETAINGGAEWIVTFNISDFGAAVERFGCQAIPPGEAARLVRNIEKNLEQA